LQTLPLEAPRLIVPGIDEKEFDRDMPVRIAVLEADKRLNFANDNTDFFPQLTNQRSHRLLAAAYFSTGEFPHALELPAFEPLGDQDPATLIAQDPRDDVELA
jgi:hypothetical protein